MGLRTRLIGKACGIYFKVARVKDKRDFGMGCKRVFLAYDDDYGRLTRIFFSTEVFDYRSGFICGIFTACAMSVRV